MAESWIQRRGAARSGFRYVTTRGKAVSAAERARIEALRIPPAWTDVHVAPSPEAAVQAWGFDAKGRKQYRYHDAAAERGQLRKYHRVRQMARDLPTMRAALARDLRGARREGLSKRRVTAGVVRLIGEAFFRVGSERYAQENRTFGITTLRKRHVTLHADRVDFAYVGKKGIAQHQTVCDASLVAFVRELMETPGPRLFRYRATSDAGRPAWYDLTARDVNEYLHDVLDVPYSAKDFRTWGGTLRLATILADLGPADNEKEAQKNVLTALRLVAAELGNTPTICRQSYVHPMVIARYLDEGTTIAPFLARVHARRASSASRSAARADAREAGKASRAAAGDAVQLPEERALIAFLDRHFPERRTKRRDRRRREREALTDRRAARALGEVAAAAQEAEQAA